MRPRVVVDASVAAKWLLPEQGSGAAAALLDARTASFHVPELFDAELANLLWKRVRRDELDAAEAAALVPLVGSIPAARHRHDGLLEGALSLALDLGITVYDALYVALAVALDARLVTFDRRLARHAGLVVQVDPPGS